MWGGMRLGQAFGDGEYEIVSSAPIGKGSGGTVYVRVSLTLTLSH